MDCGGKRSATPLWFSAERSAVAAKAVSPLCSATTLQNVGMDGQQFYRRVVQSKPWLASRFIFLTGDVITEDTQAFLHAAGNTYLNKPFRLQEVEATVTRVVSAAEAAEQKEDASCTD